MEYTNEELLRTFDERSLPDLDVAVLGALELFSHTPLPSLPRCSLVLGSGGAHVVSGLLFPDSVRADEGTYEAALDGVDTALVLSASGGKHAVEMARTLKERGILTWLLTTNPEAPANAHVAEERVVLFPKNREPYTYNTSTYLGMLLSHTGEDPEEIHAHLSAHMPSLEGRFEGYDAFYFILPPEHRAVGELFSIKFGELFGGRVAFRAHTLEESKHAKTVVPYEKECFVCFGDENERFGTPEQRVHIPLPEGAGAAAVMALGYGVIGAIQRQHPSYFKEHIAGYVKEASNLFGEEIKVIVE